MVDYNDVVSIVMFQMTMKRSRWIMVMLFLCAHADG